MVYSQIPSDLVKAAVNHNLVVFVGAGVSKDNKKIGSNEKMPGWRDLLNNIAVKIRVEKDKSFKNLLNNNSLLEVAEFLRYHASSKSLDSDFYSVIENMDKEYRIDNNEWYNKISFLNPRVIITTNYDSFLERHLNDKNDSAYSIYSPRNDQDISGISRNIKLKNHVFLKIHGGINNESIENIVITQSDYSRNIRKNPGYYRLLQSLLDTRVFLFIGYSMGDPDFQLLLHNTLNDNPISNKSLKTHYMLAGNPKPYYKKMLEDSFGISVIEYKVPQRGENKGSHAEGIDLLQNLIDSINTERERLGIY